MTIEELRIEPEFQNKIPQLTDSEFSQLEENILNDGEIREPIIVWDGIIVDGHNRYKIYNLHKDELAVPKIKVMNFENKDYVFLWMFKNQLGRRNLTDEQRDYLIGKRYEAEKKANGGDRGNQYTKVAVSHFDPLAKSALRTSREIAKEYGIGEASVRRNEAFAKSVDKADEVIEGFKDKVLSGQVKAPKTEIRKLKALEGEELRETAQKIMDNQLRDKEKSTRQIIKEIGTKESENYTDEDFYDELKGSLQILLDSVEFLLDIHSEQITSGAKKTAQRVYLSVKKIRGGLK